MKEILLKTGKIAIVDDEDFERANKIKWGELRGVNTCYARALGMNSGKATADTLHRFILGNYGNGLLVDHINRNGLDNRKQNLRFCTQKENSRNQVGTKNSTSKFKGVCFDKNRNKWMSKIRVDYKTLFIGRFKNEIEAAKAYDKAAKIHFKEFAYLNFNE